MSRRIEIERLYDAAQSTDGYRVFIDRLWPRGVSKDEFHYDAWCKDMAPTPELRKWFGHRVQNWPQFCERYRAELRQPEQQERIAALLEAAGDQTVVLLYGAKDREHNHAIILAEEIRAHEIR